MDFNSNGEKQIIEKSLC